MRLRLTCDLGNGLTTENGLKNSCVVKRKVLLDLVLQEASQPVQLRSSHSRWKPYRRYNTISTEYCQKEAHSA